LVVPVIKLFTTKRALLTYTARQATIRMSVLVRSLPTLSRPPYLRLVPPVEPSANSVELHDPAGRAREDAGADHDEGDEHCYEAMEAAYCAGRINAAAWERYALAYERERLSIEKHAW
jgi:hypothetical protein